MPLHFVAEQAGSAQAGQTVTFTGAEAHHAATVRRVRADEQVTLTDGRGTWVDARCEHVTADAVTVRVDAVHSVTRSRPFLVLAQALAKGGRDEMAVQAATELGVDEVIPWQAARSISRWSGAKAAKGTARWRTIVREAAKQAHRAWIPEVAEPVTTAQLCGRAEASTVFVLDPRADTPLTTAIDQAVEVGADQIVLVVGPEGGIAPEERERLQGAGAVIVGMGPLVMRTSTAGPAALAVLAAGLGRWAEPIEPG